MVGLGWQLEARQREAARQLKALRPMAKVLVSAELDCTFPQWAASASLIRNRSLAARVFMTRPNGSLWLDRKWGGKSSTHKQSTVACDVVEILTDCL
jgi:hypothetical protein